MDLTTWKEAKKRNKLTIADIASKAGLPKGTVQNIFAGYVPSPRLDTVLAIEQALGIHGSAVDEIGERAASLSEKEQRLLSAYNALVPPMQDFVIEMVEKLVRNEADETQNA